MGFSSPHDSFFDRHWSVVLSIILFKMLPTDFIPDEDIGFIIAYTEAEQGTSSDQMHQYQQQVIKF